MNEVQEECRRWQRWPEAGKVGADLPLCQEKFDSTQLARVQVRSGGGGVGKQVARERELHQRGARA